MELCLEREPSLIFDLLAAYIPHPTSDPQQQAWCICTKCKELPTDLERKCCGQLLDSCVSMLPHMDAYIMQGGVLRLARRIWNDVRAVADRPDPGEDNKQFRSAPSGSLLFGNTEHWLGDTGSSSLVVVSGGYGTSTQTHLDNMLASSQGDFKHH